ncbi:MULTISPECIES: 2-hydroxymuconic semialdehyde dehydrogenase [Burkholderia cepacia complex]|uniref:2-hydroxymuconic semialdehyde dehydrogenase n=1 Tax=Burkholderia cepacia complex TaxID=87882 RepID=UPI001CF278D6|nr:MULTISPECIES: 2-hydroxymuconic semialdehyde dehydrogenase [Burkholderia cepacia complex]MCA8005931.1 2-hydroxymuconic semialdehyde dehydrogenase [Burkholderia cenocepacia]MCL4649990.1 2-hydroxymuconic semialdehyde dehydrogenase [Burkholderia multivorans]MCL4658852.1 2-hydroxymuconic semialdehyde dehydrogenase [Burkholderia multivorans]MCO1424778.1 2-hydroxymuconic semialdehyde dehydrogenase [Burkholderia multivorans]UQN54670.1 2-hydroxymuconic semialdehyde dehydrogenase [Burkholderia multiv
MKHYRNFVDGRWVESTRTFEDISPVDGSLVAIVHEASRDLVDQAVKAGHRAVAGEWGRTGTAERVAMLRRIADEMERRQDDFLAAEMADTGKPLAMASSIDIPRGIANFRAFADMLATAPLDSHRLDLADGGYALNYAARKPLGVVGVISPWNLPLLLLTWKVAPALACGNAVVVKPSEETPGSATLLAEVMEAAGVPPGVFNLVHGFGPDSAGEFISRHEDISAITFTGESRTGTTIMRAAAEGVKPVSFELGGKNAAIIFADCDFDKMLDGMMRALFLNSGQVCLCSERVYVERPLFDRFCTALVERIKAMKIDWPNDPNTHMGPLISAKHRDKVMSYFGLARDEGATFLTGGKALRFGDERDDGAWVEPTVITGLPDDARSVREEIFGPICHVAPFDSEREVIARANDTRYGLAATIWTSNLSRAHRVSESMRVGISWVNTWFLRDLRTPFGGAGLSGIGREGGMHSLNFYSELTNVCVRVDEEIEHV